MATSLKKIKRREGSTANYGGLLRWLYTQKTLQTDAAAVSSALACDNYKAAIVSIMGMLLITATGHL
ncbi:hypothetical protein IHE33_04995 [Mycetohabitans endofungorum]|uniref:hypothetical protein n=1 Tax=Mycetohabitans endofungorum TaxID=417203 RepID=UPI0030CB3D89